MVIAVIATFPSLSLGHQDVALQTLEELKLYYQPIAELAMVATTEDKSNRFEYAVRRDGSFSYLHFSKDRFDSIYGVNRDISDWVKYPTHMNFYDGQYMFKSSASFDPAGMIEERVFEHPFEIGQPIQVKACLWPFLNKLLESGEIVIGINEVELVIDHLSLTVLFDRYGRIKQVTWWRENKNSPIYTWLYDGYTDLSADALPAKMIQTTYSLNKDGKCVSQHVHMNLLFIHDPETIAKMLVFVDDSSNYRKKDVATDNVYDPEGNLLYNEKEMADEYLAAIKNSGPSQWRLILLVGVGCLAIGSAVILKLKKAAWLGV